MEFDLASAERYIVATFERGVTVADGMERIITYCSKKCPSPQWRTLANLDYEADNERLTQWFAGALKQEPPGKSINGLWFGMFNPIERGKATAEMYLAGTDRFDPNDPDAFCGPAYWPEGSRYSGSKVLREIYRIAYARKDSLGNTAEFSLCLGYCALVVIHLCRTVPLPLLLGEAKRRAIAVGFDSGDVCLVGSVTKRGFRLNKRKSSGSD